MSEMYSFSGSTKFAAYPNGSSSKQNGNSSDNTSTNTTNSQSKRNSCTFKSSVDNTTSSNIMGANSSNTFLSSLVQDYLFNPVLSHLSNTASFLNDQVKVEVNSSSQQPQAGILPEVVLNGSSMPSGSYPPSTADTEYQVYKQLYRMTKNLLGAGSFDCGFTARRNSSGIVGSFSEESKQLLSNLYANATCQTEVVSNLSSPTSEMNNNSNFMNKIITVLLPTFGFGVSSSSESVSTPVSPKAAGKAMDENFNLSNGKSSLLGSKKVSQSATASSNSTADIPVQFPSLMKSLSTNTRLIEPEVCEGSNRHLITNLLDSVFTHGLKMKRGECKRSRSMSEVELCSMMDGITRATPINNISTPTVVDSCGESSPEQSDDSFEQSYSLVQQKKESVSSKKKKGMNGGNSLDMDLWKGLFSGINCVSKSARASAPPNPINSCIVNNKANLDQLKQKDEEVCKQNTDAAETTTSGVDGQQDEGTALQQDRQRKQERRRKNRRRRNRKSKNRSSSDTESSKSSSDTASTHDELSSDELVTGTSIVGCKKTKASKCFSKGGGSRRAKRIKSGSGSNGCPTMTGIFVYEDEDDDDDLLLQFEEPGNSERKNSLKSPKSPKCVPFSFHYDDEDEDADEEEDGSFDEDFDDEDDFTDEDHPDACLFSKPGLMVGNLFRSACNAAVSASSASPVCDNSTTSASNFNNLNKRQVTCPGIPSTVRAIFNGALCPFTRGNLTTQQYLPSAATVTLPSNSIATASVPPCASVSNAVNIPVLSPTIQSSSPVALSSLHSLDTQNEDELDFHASPLFGGSISPDLMPRLTEEDIRRNLEMRQQVEEEEARSAEKMAEVNRKWNLVYSGVQKDYKEDKENKRPKNALQCDDIFDLDDVDGSSGLELDSSHSNQSSLVKSQSKFEKKNRKTANQHVHFIETDPVVHEIDQTPEELERSMASRERYWETFALDRARHREMCEKLSVVLNPVFTPEHRDRIFRERFAGSLNSQE